MVHPATSQNWPAAPIVDGHLGRHDTDTGGTFDEDGVASQQSVILFDSFLEPLQEGLDDFEERFATAFRNLQQSSQTIWNVDLFRQIVSRTARCQIAAGQSKKFLLNKVSLILISN